jgi:protein-S-isoprenylcysteine O-methyltransferase Ste14
MSARLSASGVVRIVTVVAVLAAVAVTFFAAAGTLDVARAWIYYGGLTAYVIVAMLVMFVRYKGAAEIVNERGKMKKDVKTWDKVFGISYTLLMFVVPLVAGLDVGRLRWSRVPEQLAIPSLAVTILAYAFVHWAMIVNRHAETGVRIQNDRGHEVVSSGPYRFVRHPFYIAIIVSQLVYPLAVGSLVAYAPALLIAALFVWRTALEDNTLRRELPGYEAYAALTKYRLLPLIW